MKRIGWLLAWVALCTPASSHAHQKSLSYSKWTLLGDDAVGEVRVRWLELTSLPFFAADAPTPFDRDEVISYLERSLTFESAAGPCEPIPKSATWLPTETGWARVGWQVHCDGAPLRMRSELFHSLSNHVHLATVRGTEPHDLVLSTTAPLAGLTGAGTDQPGGIARYLRLGVEHIVSGWDHLAFLLLLIVTAPRLRDVAVLVTGFTVGHSATLAAASLGLVVPNARAVEAAIAASILIVALENMGMQRARGGALALGFGVALFVASAAFGGLPAFWGVALFTLCYFGLLRTLGVAAHLRWVIACLFGLVHGLGFAGVLLEQELPKGQLVHALLGFNVGVELGQLAIVTVLWPVLQQLRRRAPEDRVVDAASIAGAAVAVFALVVRVFSP